MFYRFRLALLFNYPYDINLDTILLEQMKSGIKEIDSSETHHVTIEFNMGGKMRAWDANRYYAWLNEGTISKNNEIYRWRDCRPSAKTMYLLKTMIKNYFLEKFKTNPKQHDCND